MALTIVPDKTLAHLREGGYAWIDVRVQYLDDLLKKYRDLEIGVMDDVLNQKFTLHARKYPAHHTLIENLLSNVRQSELSKGLPVLDVAESVYRPILKGFNRVKLSQRNKHPSHPVDASEAEDLIVSGIRYGSRQDCLYTANGFFVQPIHGATDTRLLGAAKIMYFNADTSCGMLVMPGEVTYSAIDPDTAEFNEDGDLYVPIKDGNDTPAIVIGGRLFIAGMDRELKRRGANFALFRFDHTFIVDWLVRYAPLLYPNQKFDIMDTERLTSVEMKRIFLKSEYCFQVVLKGNGYWRRDSAVERHWWLTHRHTNFKDASDYYGLVLKPNGRVCDYWGVYYNVANILYSTANHWDRGDNFHAHSTQYMREGMLTDKRNLKPEPQYYPARARYYCKRK